MANIIDIIVRAKDVTAGAWGSVKAGAQKLRSDIKKSLGDTFDFAKRAAAGILLVGAAAFAAAAKAVSAYKESAQAQAKLEAAQKATGNASGRTTAELNKQADALETLTGVDGDLITSLQATLASFDQINGKTFDRATVAVLDMASALRKAGQDQAAVEKAARNVGKALQAAGGSAFKQDKILSDLEKRYGGTAEAIGKASHGLDLLKVTFGNVIEEVGKTITETKGFDGAIAQLTQNLKKLITEGKIARWAKDARDALAKMAHAAKVLIDHRLEITFGLIAGAGIKLAAELLAVEKAFLATKAAAIVAATATGVATAATDAAAAAALRLKIAWGGVAGIGWAAIAAGFVAIAVQARKAANAIDEARKSQERLGGQDAQFKGAFGVRVETARKIRVAIETDDKELLAKLEKVYPDAVKKIAAAMAKAKNGETPAGAPTDSKGFFEKVSRDEMGDQLVSEKAKADKAEAVKQAKADKKRIEDAAKLLEVEKQIQQVRDDEIKDMFAGIQKAAADRAEQLEKDIAGAATTMEEIREKRRAKRDATKEDAREKELIARSGRRGQTLSEKDQAFLSQRQAVRDLATARADEARAAKNEADRIATEAKNQRAAQLTSLQNMEADLKKALQAPG